MVVVVKVMEGKLVKVRVKVKPRVWGVVVVKVKVMGGESGGGEGERDEWGEWW